MKKVLYFFILVLFTTCLSYSQVTTLWEKSAAAGTVPAWDAGTIRGIAYGVVNNNHRLFVATRAASVGGKQIFIFNATTGDSVGSLDTTGIIGGTLAINDVEVSTDGKIFVCNLASGGIFKVYKYDTEASAPVAIIDYDATGMRLGDKITVTGSTADNSIIIWAANATGNGNILKFKTTDNGVTFIPEIINKTTTGTAPSVGPLGNGDFYYNIHGGRPQKYTAAGTLIGEVASAVISTGGSSVRYLRAFNGDEYLLASEVNSTTINFAKIIKIPAGTPASATLYGTTPLLGAANASGSGDIAFQKVNHNTFNAFVVSPGNGFGAYEVKIDMSSLAGNYYIGAPGTGPNGSDPDFANLREAFDVLNEATFTGDCTFYITSNITETYVVGPNYGIGLAIDPTPYTVTLKPQTGVQPVITLPYPADETSGPSGALVIGLPSKGNIAWADMKTTKNIIIDGSNTVDGTTRDLTIECSTTAHRNGFPLAIVGDVSNMVVKNTNIYYKAQGVSTSGNLFVGAVQVRSRNFNSVDWVPNNILFENNHMSANFEGVVQSAQGYVTYQTGTPLPTNYPYNITLKNNVIEGKRRAVTLNIAGSHDIFGNEIILNQDIAANTTNEAIYGYNVQAGSIVNIYNNRITKISSKTNAANSGNSGINIETAGTYNIYNNFITGFELTAENPASYLYGIKNSSASATLNLNFNSIYMNDLSSIGTGTVVYNGILLSNGTNDIKNNIVYSAEADFASYCINRTGTMGTLVSNYNDFYPVSSTNGNVGFWNDAAASNLAAWKTASGQDANSISKAVFFVSATDLHLTGASLGDLSLIGTPIAEITLDIDGDLRDAFFPYMGADESSPALPVELTSFSAKLSGKNIELSWTTATETNNNGFEVERKINNAWEKIGFVQGQGTTTQAASYGYTDENISAAKLEYRLKQIDFDGSYNYSKTVEVTGLISSFELMQNYPNPFNPTTEISFTIPVDTKVKLEIFSLTGELVEILSNEFLSAGKHIVKFNASGYASGTYIYRLNAGNVVLSKKMILMK